MTKKRSLWAIATDPFGQAELNEEKAKRAVDLAKLGAFLDGVPVFMADHIEETITKIRNNFDSAIECENTFMQLSKKLTPYKNMFNLLKSENKISGYHTYTTGADMVDPSQFTCEEIARLSDKFNAIHDVAMAYNVEVSFGGFDNLPRSGTYANGSFQGGRGVVVSFNTLSNYPIVSNPEFGARNDTKCVEFDQKLNTRFKHGL